MKKILLIIAAFFISIASYAQHEHHQHTQPEKQVTKPAAKKPVTKKATVSKPLPKKAVEVPQAAKAKDTAKAMPAHDHSQHKQAEATTSVTATQPAEHTQHAGHEMNMSHAYSLSLPMNRNGSGTGWLPDSSPMYGYMAHSKKWMYMFHGNLFLRYNNQDFSQKGIRGDAKFDAPNWLMAMGQRQVGTNGLFHFNVMLSADALTSGRDGYPLLFQTGETYQGKPLIDRQHPHDLFSELSVSYAHRLSDKADVFAYLGYPGEPALGPVAFMHRPSALYNPDAPLSHHWVDATHITFGVATLGFRYGKFKIEGSSFTGREPDENRYNFDKPRFDSRSARLSFNPTENWALQVSQAYINSPEVLHAGEDVNRTTASAVYSKRYGKDMFFNATGLWGMNKTKGHSGEHAAMLEGSLAIKRLAIYGRYEWVQKSVEELALPEEQFGHDALFPVNAVTVGGAYDVVDIKPLRLAAGAQFSVYSADKRLNYLYGNSPMALEVYLRLYPGLMR